MISTTPTQRAALAAAGFVRVDGLQMRHPAYLEKGEIIPSGRHLGRWDYNNGFTVVQTLAGEVWLAFGGITPQRAEIIKDLCPEGQGAYVPCSNGGQLASSDILKRMFDPDWQPL